MFTVKDLSATFVKVKKKQWTSKRRIKKSKRFFRGYLCEWWIYTGTLKLQQILRINMLPHTLTHMPAKKTCQQSYHDLCLSLLLFLSCYAVWVCFFLRFSIAVSFALRKLLAVDICCSLLLFSVVCLIFLRWDFFLAYFYCFRFLRKKKIVFNSLNVNVYVPYMKTLREMLPSIFRNLFASIVF